MRDGRFPLSLLLLLGACSTIAPLALNMHVPALGEIADAFARPRADASLTVTVYLWVFGISMLFAGLPSDRWGRRPTLLAGLSLFSAGAVLAAGVDWPPWVEWLDRVISISPLWASPESTMSAANESATSLRFNLLLSARGLQALGAALIVVVPRTMINDRTQGETAVKLLGGLATIMAAAPALAPIAGAGLSIYFGWTTIFWVQVLLGMSLFAWCFWKLPETHEPLLRSKAEVAANVEDEAALIDDKPTRIAPEEGAYRPLSVIVQPVLVMSTLMAVYYAYLAGGADASLVYYSKTPAALAALLAVLSLIYVLGNITVMRGASALSLMGWVRVGVGFTVVSIPVTFLSSTYLTTGVGMCIYAFGVGLVMPTSLAVAGSVVPRFRAHVMSVASSSPFLLGGVLSFLANVLNITTWPRFEWLMATCVAACMLLVLTMRDRRVELPLTA